MINIEIGDKKYKVEIAKTEEERAVGLSNRTNLPEDEGMLFVFTEPQEVSFWMKDTSIPLDIIFIDDDEEVIQVSKGEPNSEKQITVENVLYVLEVNQDSGIKEGDELEIDDDDLEKSKMIVLDSNGDIQMKLEGGERIFSRISTKVMIKKAKKANNVKSDLDKFNKACKALGKYVFKELIAQNTRPPEYVNAPDSKS